MNKYRVTVYRKQLMDTVIEVEAENGAAACQKAALLALDIPSPKWTFAWDYESWTGPAEKIQTQEAPHE